MKFFYNLGPVSFLNKAASDMVDFGCMPGIELAPQFRQMQFPSRQKWATISETKGHKDCIWHHLLLAE